MDRHIVHLVGSFLVAITLAVSEGHCKTSPAKLSEEKEILLGILPNGLSVLPDCDSHHTSILSFAYGKLQRNPFLDLGREPKSSEEFLQIIRKHKIGDLMYDDAEGGSLVACTNRIKSLGKGLLKEVSVTTKPEIPKKDWIPAKVGKRYLKDDRRKLCGVQDTCKKNKRAIKIQWIYQPDGTQKFNIKGEFLDRKVGDCNIESKIEGTMSMLRGIGLRLCIEKVEKTRESSQRSLSVKNATIRSLLNAFVKTWPEYRWEHVEGTNIVWLYARKGSILNFTPADILKLPVKDRSALQVIKDMRLGRRGIIYPYRGWGPVNPPLPDKKISIDAAAKDSVRTILGKICWSYGDGLVANVGPCPGHQIAKKRLSLNTYPRRNLLNLLIADNRPRVKRKTKSLSQ